MTNPITAIVDHMMIPFLAFSYQHVYANYGVAIILLTLVVKVAFFPLTHRQFTSMRKLQVLQPQIKAIQEQHKGNPEKLQKSLMEFYKTNRVNPFGGCLPLLLQLPFLLAIYSTVKSNLFLTMISAPGVFPGLFSFWLPNLGKQDTTFILAILMGITTYLSQRLMPFDPQMGRIMMFMPIFMVVISVNMPSGVLLYWVVSSVISYGQQWVIIKQSH